MFEADSFVKLLTLRCIHNCTRTCVYTRFLGVNPVPVRLNPKYSFDRNFFSEK